GEIEPQLADAERGQSFGDALGGLVVLAAGKAMGEQCISARLAHRVVEERGKSMSLGIGEIEAFTRHRRLLVCRSPERTWPKGYGPNSSAAPRPAIALAGRREAR